MTYTILTFILLLRELQNQRCSRFVYIFFYRKGQVYAGEKFKFCSYIYIYVSSKNRFAFKFIGIYTLFPICIRKPLVCTQNALKFILIVGKEI